MKKGVLNKAVRLLYPARCPGCDDILPGASGMGVFCESCRGEVVLAHDRICFRCGKPIISAVDDLCRDCKSKEPAIVMGRGAFVYTGPMKLAMYRLKYSGRRSYVRGLARIAYTLHHKWFDSLGIQAVIPIPMYENKKRQRGYNQAEVFAEAISVYLSVPVYPEVLRRVRNTAPQKGLDRQMRQKNLENAFKIAQSGVKFDCVLLVDDIYTTGATINEAARVLGEGFGCRVFSFCICMGAD